MPKKGYTQITVANDLKERLRRAAKAEGLSMPALVLMMLENQYPDYPEPNGPGEEREK